jgi:apolipoprotein N-acyltransferase
MLRYALAAASGTLYFLGFAGFDLWPLAFVALLPMLWALDPMHEAKPVTTRQVFGAGLVFGLVTNAGGYYWLVGMLRDFSGFPLVLCVLFAAVVWAYQGLVLALFGFLYHRARKLGFGNVLAATLAMCLAEWLYPMLFTHYFGNSLHTLPYAIQTADLGGPLLSTALLTAANAGLYTLSLSMQRHRVDLRDVAIAAALWLFNLGYGAYRIHEVDERAAAADKLALGIVQTNMGIFQKRADPIEGLRRHIEQSEELQQEHELDLLVWPESAYGWYLPERTENVRELVTGRSIHTPLLFGGLSRRRVDGVLRPHNTAFLVDAEGRVLDTYDKTYLLAFGEYIPLGDTFPKLYELSPNTSHFARGNHVRSLSLGRHRIGALICYEDILPAFVRKVMAEGEPHVLINLTNDAWFGDTHEPWEHLALAKFRSVEHHRSLVRATNSGVSAVIDPVGRVVTQSGTFTRENLHAEIPMLTGRTLYSYVGDWVGPLSLVVLVGQWLRRRRGAHSA